MRLVLTGRNVEVTPALRQLITRKLTKLDRVLNDSALSAQVVLTREKYRHVCEITIHARGDHMLHGLGDGSAWPMSLKQATEKIATQAQKLTSKWKTRRRRAASARIQPPAVPPAAEVPPPSPRIIRAARYAVKPMTVEDAALRVGAGPDAFLVFRNAATETISVLYRRKDGHLGLIEP